MAIDSFKDEYAFLSNFYPCTVTVSGQTFLNSESAYQCQKCVRKEDKAQFSSTTGAEAKKIGRKVECVPNWDSRKVGTMRLVLREKFAQNEDLAKLLMDTGTEELIEGNNWKDTFWGVCDGKGYNYLGRMLMELRLGYSFL